MGFKGLIVTDSLLMKAIADHFDQAEAALLAINAGVDILILQKNFEYTFSKVLKAVKSGEIPVSRINESAKRILELKLKKGWITIKNGKLVLGLYKSQTLPEKIDYAKRIVRCAEHQRIEDLATNGSVTSLKRIKTPFPLDRKKIKVISLFATSDKILQHLQETLKEMEKNKKIPSLKVNLINYEGRKALSAKDKQQVTGADLCIIFTRLGTIDINNSNQLSRTQFPIALHQYALLFKKPTWDISMGLPLEPLLFKNAKNIYAVYGSSQCSVRAGLESVLLSETPKGRLPISLK